MNQVSATVSVDLNRLASIHQVVSRYVPKSISRIYARIPSYSSHPCLSVAHISKKSNNDGEEDKEKKGFIQIVEEDVAKMSQNVAFYQFIHAWEEFGVSGSTLGIWNTEFGDLTSQQQRQGLLPPPPYIIQSETQIENLPYEELFCSLEWCFTTILITRLIYSNSSSSQILSVIYNGLTLKSENGFLPYTLWLVDVNDSIYLVGMYRAPSVLLELLRLTREGNPRFTWNTIRQLKGILHRLMHEQQKDIVKQFQKRVSGYGLEILATSTIEVMSVLPQPAIGPAVMSNITKWGDSLGFMFLSRDCDSKEQQQRMEYALITFIIPTNYQNQYFPLFVHSLATLSQIPSGITFSAEVDPFSITHTTLHPDLVTQHLSAAIHKCNNATTEPPSILPSLQFSVSDSVVSSSSPPDESDEEEEEEEDD